MQQKQQIRPRQKRTWLPARQSPAEEEGGSSAEEEAASSLNSPLKASSPVSSPPREKGRQSVSGRRGQPIRLSEPVTSKAFPTSQHSRLHTRGPPLMVHHLLKEVEALRDQLLQQSELAEGRADKVLQHRMSIVQLHVLLDLVSHTPLRHDYRSKKWSGRRRQPPPPRAI